MKLIYIMLNKIYWDIMLRVKIVMMIDMKKKLIFKNLKIINKIFNYQILNY